MDAPRLIKWFAVTILSAFLFQICPLWESATQADDIYEWHTYEGYQWRLERLRYPDYPNEVYEQKNSYGLCAAVNDQKNLYILSQTENDGDVSLLQLDEKGEEKWKSKVGISSPFRITDSTLTMSSAQDSLLIVLRHFGFYYIKYSTEGDLLWDVEIVIDGGSFQAVDRVLPAPTGHFLVFGDWETGGVTQKALLNLANDGTITWLVFIDDSISASDIAVDAKGNIYLAGIENETDVHPGEIALIKYSNRGEILWHQYHSVEAKVRKFNKPSIAIDGDGDFTVFLDVKLTAFQDYLPRHLLLAFRYSSHGEPVWEFSADEVGEITRSDVIINNQQGVWLAFLVMANSTTLHLIELSTTGEPLWFAEQAFNLDSYYTSINTVGLTATVDHNDHLFFVVDYVFSVTRPEVRILEVGWNAKGDPIDSHYANYCYDPDEGYFQLDYPLFFQLLGSDPVYLFMEDNDIKGHAESDYETDDDSDCGCGDQPQGPDAQVSALMFLVAAIAFVLATPRKRD